MSSSSGAGAPVFSYAQAAKGLTSASSTQSASRNEGSAASDKGVKDRSLIETTNTTSTVKSPQPRSESEDKSNGEGAASKSPIQAEGPAAKSSAEDADKEGATPQTQHVATHNNAEISTGSHVGTPNLAPAQDQQKGDAVPQLPNGRSLSPEELPGSTSSDKSNQSVTEKKSRDGEDDWEKVSVPSVSAEAQYKAAPIPTVNIWQVRREAQAAKLKGLEQQRGVASSAPIQPPKPRSGSEDIKRKSLSKESGSSEKERKSVDSAKPVPRKDTSSARSSRPASQHGEKVDVHAPPPVDDAQSWPTPENSNVDERRKSASLEKTDKLDGKPGSQKTHSNKWVAVPFVPTAKFETQLPPAAARRGGRGGGRGRDIGGRGGGHAGSAAEKQDGTTSMGPPPLPRQSGEQDRGRRSEGERGPRGASVPNTSTRPTSGEDANPTFWKSSASYVKDQSASENAPADPTAPQHTVDEQAPRTDHSSRSSSRHTGNVGGRMTNGDGTTSIEQGISSHSQTNEPIARYSYGFDRYKGSGTGGSRATGEFGRDRGSGRNRDWSRDKPDSAREKVESWRDREPSGDQSNRREPRSERGRGYRGRGNNSYNTTFTASHAYTSPLPQNGFEPPSRANSHTETRARQASQPFVPSQTSNSTRTNPRSQSIPVGMMFQGYYNGMPAMPQGLPSIQTDMSMYGYPSQMQMQPSIMSAMPYNDPLNSYALLSMVMTQIEYYFSIDNLCKDLFLRKHMDGQGYVPLSVIANFKRIKTLTEDNMTMDNLRYVCQQVKSVEFLPGTDGDDRLRRREGWRDFVLPVEERFESARNEGPLHNPESYSHPAQADQVGLYDASFAFGQLRSPQLAVGPSNGTFHANSPMSYVPGLPTENPISGQLLVRPSEDGSSDETERPSMVSYQHVAPAAMRSPPQHASEPLSNIVNGHHRQSSRADIEDNIFPDEQIPNVNIRMQPTALSGAAPSFPGIDRVPSAGSSGGQNEGNNVPLDLSQARLPSLRGGASSPQQLEQYRSLSFGGPYTIPTGDENIIYFTKDGQETQLPPPQPGQFDQTYLSLHDMAFQQRQIGVEGALEPLYNFWTDFLVDKFNVGMYQEFKTTAVGDLDEGSDSGMSHLVRYFGKLLSAPVPISERLASDMIALYRDEKPDKRPIFQTLRAAWRNGATNMKTIKRLGDILTAEEKAELDKSG
ncbi:uncharacterized protein Z520_08921 [Fonsecaea multimorphosa CBS 102226]|uniref:HTH La-type RNA-binding domain-containing protein n=1 Tax=Fonsecaea multimorphosa CBS 102226 TaxID=1442371 RepID=A0A0D2JY25_9EURO|nr:uncharacterized protein Z520_08921 [Fonsecaea multimorphosa CBS 102226]KIX95404.1 hypothetical protein Z520_08921 [Fonsecaea multimorphosa CBS 102226]OAL21071.1 hypothetical protein AYO22_08355 [Fonsecaea multimorphosa]